MNNMEIDPERNPCITKWRNTIMAYPSSQWLRWVRYLLRFFMLCQQTYTCIVFDALGGSFCWCCVFPAGQGRQGGKAWLGHQTVLPAGSAFTAQAPIPRAVTPRPSSAGPYSTPQPDTGEPQANRMSCPTIWMWCWKHNRECWPPHQVYSLTLEPRQETTTLPFNRLHVLILPLC